jgi:hypothetical protein
VTKGLLHSNLKSKFHMKKVYFLFLLIISFEKDFSQNCISLGCAANYGIRTADGTLPDLPGTNLGSGCVNSATYKQVFWQFFYSPAGGDFTQAYTPIPNGVDALDLDYIVYDIGTAAPTSIPCPIDPIPWTDIVCNNSSTDDVPTGPGVAGAGGNVLSTTAGHYYAIAITSWQGISNGGVASYTFTIDNPQLGGVDLTSANCPGVLPVALSSFNVTINNCIVDLNWAASEANFKNYDIQYSIDGIKFQTIATMAGELQGANQKYAYQHNNPPQGNIYYRLKMTGIDGKFEYSKIIPLKLFCNRSSLIVYPNPVTDILNINITNLQNEVTIASLFDNTGKLMYSHKMVSGTNMIDMKKFAKGVYLLKLKNNVETQNIKIIK